MINPVKCGAANGNGGAVVVERVADILESELEAVIAEWLYRVEQETEPASVR